MSLQGGKIETDINAMKRGWKMSSFPSSKYDSMMGFFRALPTKIDQLLKHVFRLFYPKFFFQVADLFTSAINFLDHGDWFLFGSP